MTTRDTGTTPVWKIAAAWLTVSIPFVWGIFETVKSALKLFEQ